MTAPATEKAAPIPADVRRLADDAIQQHYAGSPYHVLAFDYVRQHSDTIARAIMQDRADRASQEERAREDEREGWKPIETAPKDDPLRSILIATRGYVGGVVQVSWSDTHQDFVDQDEDTYPDATHWQPLPSPPSPAREPSHEPR